MVEITRALNFRTDPEWHQVDIEGFEKVEWLVAPLNNDLHQKKLERLLRPHKKKIRKGTLSLDLNKEIGAKAMGGAILIGWRSKDGQGEPLEFDGQPFVYSEKNAEKLLQYSQVFLSEIVEIAQDMTEKREEEEAEDEEDLGKP